METKKYEVLKGSELGVKINGKNWKKGDIVESEFTSDIQWQLSNGVIKEIKFGTPNGGEDIPEAPKVEEKPKEEVKPVVELTTEKTDEKKEDNT